MLKQEGGKNMEKILITIAKIIKHPAFQIAVAVATTAIEVMNQLEEEE
jgi:hypothetical protein